VGASESVGLKAYGELLSIGDVRRVVSWGLIGRLPLGMSALALVLLVRGEGGSYAAAGVVSAAFALASGAGAPVGGRLVDRHRATVILTGYAAAFGLALLALAALAHAGAPLATLIGAAAVAGFAAPPIAPTVRTMWPLIAPTPDLRATAFALEATLQEVIFVSGPLLVAALSASISPGAGVPAAAILGSAGATGFALTSTIRSRRPDPALDRSHRQLHALAPADVRLTLVFTAFYGVVFGAAEVAMPAFAEGLDELTSIARGQTTAILCAEAVPWRCHRSLIADALTLRGWEVREIISAAPAQLHKLTPFLKVADGLLTYPPEQPELPM